VKREHLDVILNNVAELKSLFLLGQRTIPFLEDIFTFVQGMIPLMDELKSSVELSPDKLPMASRQLDNVTHATEVASTEILDLVENIDANIESLTTELLQTIRVAAHTGLIVRLSDALVQSIDEGTPAPENVRKLRAVIREHYDLTHQTLPTIPLEEVLTSIRSDCTNIMMALQVQDITSQQIAAVNRIMQSIDEGFDRLLDDFHGPTPAVKNDAYRHLHLSAAFDQSAEYTGGKERQQKVDPLIGKMRSVGAPD
jgi:chemotaxis regulatin CheY-phosphate phosphatase CheZ